MEDAPLRVGFDGEPVVDFFYDGNLQEFVAGKHEERLVLKFKD